MTADGQKWTKFSVELSGPAKNEVLLQSQCVTSSRRRSKHQQRQTGGRAWSSGKYCCGRRQQLNGLYTAKGNVSQFKGWTPPGTDATRSICAAAAGWRSNQCFKAEVQVTAWQHFGHFTLSSDSCFWWIALSKGTRLLWLKLSFYLHRKRELLVHHRLNTQRLTLVWIWTQ